MAPSLKSQVMTFFKGLRGGSDHPLLSDAQLASLESVCIFMGPYRNLTTLTSALLNLHPHCQVLNHAAPRVLDDDAINFLGHYSDDRFSKFCHFAIEASQGGKRGDHGGSITLSHAFDHEVMSSTYEERYSGQLRKQEVRSIIWKDSQRITNYLRDNQLLDPILKSNGRVRFLMPIRNPMDCAISNSNSRKSEHLLSRGGSLHDVLEAVCREISWFQQQKQQQPDRFFSFFENQFDEALLGDFAAFLGLEATPQWVEDAQRVFQIKPSYDHDAGLVARYEQLIDEYFVDTLVDQAFADDMARFIAR